MYSQSEQIQSTLEIFDIETNERKIVLQEQAHFEAPNWSPDGSYFIINQNGLLYKVAIDGSQKELLPTGNLKNCNNDHGISFDGKLLAISNNDKVEGATSGTSRIYTMPISGGTPKLITPDYPSYWHGWSPDGKTLVYTAKRNDNFDIFSISSEGGEEKRLTDSPGLDDGPEYSPNGQFIYYNSMQSGKMEIWRMKADGSIPQQLTDDSYSNWFAHPSPNGRYFVFISYLEDQGNRHPPMKKVALRLYDLDSGDIRTLCKFTGGQGTINVPSWAPDNKRFAFVSYKETGN
jgi:Tol biopolymer transport system component